MMARGKSKKRTDETSAIGRLVRCAERESPYLSDEGWAFAMKQIEQLRDERPLPISLKTDK